MVSNALILAMFKRLCANNIMSVSGRRGGSKKSSIIPICDVDEGSSEQEQVERTIRCKLAALYRVLNNRGWSAGIYGHLTARVANEGQVLMNAYGLLWQEVTAGNLVKVDMEGNLVQKGNTPLCVSKAAFVLHSAVYKVRTDIKCIIHTHVNSTVAVSSMKCGLLKCSQAAMCLGDISYHGYEGMVIDESECKTIQENLGPVNKVMLLRNHGIVVCGETVEEAFILMDCAIEACDAQAATMVAGYDNVICGSDKAIKKVEENICSQNFTMGDSDIAWSVGEMEFEAEMRVLDRAGYKTGYSYKMPFLLPKP